MNFDEIYTAVIADDSAKNPYRFNFKLQNLLKDYNTVSTEQAIEDLTFALRFFQQKQIELASIKQKENSFCSQILDRHKLLNCSDDE